MSETRDVIIVGGGHNGLVAAFYLAKAGFKPLVLERRAQVGGAAITEEFHPGFRCSTLAHNTGPLRADIVRDMQLEKHGLKLTTPDVSTVSLLPDGRSLVLYSDAKKAAQEIAEWSQKDAASYLEFGAALGKIGKVMAEALALTPPDIDNPSQWRSLGNAEDGPLAPETRQERFVSRAALGADGRCRSGLGVLRQRTAARHHRRPRHFRNLPGPVVGGQCAGVDVARRRRCIPISPAGSVQFPAGGAGAITQAMAAAAKQAGAEIRTDADIAEIRVKDGVATGVVLASGEEISARAVVSNADPKRTLMRLVDPSHLTPDFVQRIKNYRSMGTVAKINLALSALPEFTALKAKGNGNLLRSRIQISPEIDYLERAFDESKYGNFSRNPYLEITFPSLSDPSLAPAGQHVMSIYMQYAPYKLKNSDWESQRAALGETVVNTIAQYAPNLPQTILDGQIITPKDLEETYGLTGGHIFHGELALDQFFTMRPLLDWARYQTPIERLYLCGSGTHPGTGLTGGSGANAAREIAKTLKK